MSQYIAALLLVVVPLIVIGAVWLGFAMGCHSTGKPLHVPRLNKSGGQPLFEESPWDEAREEKPKSEGSL